MKAVILAGGRGTRIGEDAQSRPKPMIEIGEMPILWHIMKIYAVHGIREFVICLGYRGYVIKDFFANYLLHQSNVTIHLKQNRMVFHHEAAEDWDVTLLETGMNTETGGRIRKAIAFLGDDAEFCLTYGDGVGDINIRELIAHHRKQGLLATVTGVQPPGRFGALDVRDGKVRHFLEKPRGDGGYINGGFFVLSSRVGEYIASDETVWEKEPLERLAKEGQLGMYHHAGFWQPMDTPRDKQHLEQIWSSGRAPWKLW